MRINRHDKRLDELLGKRVEIEFTDGDVYQGTLRWNRKFEAPLYIHSQMYYLEKKFETHGSTIVSFRKGHVKSIRAL